MYLISFLSQGVIKTLLIALNKEERIHETLFEKQHPWPTLSLQIFLLLPTKY